MRPPHEKETAVNLNPIAIRAMVRAAVRRTIRNAIARAAVVDDLAHRLAPALAGLNLAPDRKAPPSRARAPKRRRRVIAEFKGGRRVA